MTEAMNLLESLRSKSSPSPMMAKLMDDPEPKEVDWRKVPNRVSPVGDHKGCKSHGAFAVAGLLEGQEVTRNISKLIPLSVQQMIDCSRYDNFCDNGFITSILYSFSEDYFSFESEADYPYEAKRKACRLDDSKWLPNMFTKRPGFIPMGDEKGLLRFVANHGPIAVSLYPGANFNSYHSGVFNDNNCSSNPFNGYYGVLIVGYGTDPKEGDYWIIKNSRGVNWGEEGYRRIKRGVNMCGISDFGTYSKF